MPNTSKTPVVHLHGQNAQHDAAYIVGNRDGLKVLRHLIDRALGGAGDPNINEEMSRYLFVSDGESFPVSVRLLDRPFGDALWDRERMPYFDEMARDTRPWSETTPME